MKQIDLNADMGEMPEAIANGSQESLMPFLTSVSVACGGHAGDEASMHATMEQARRHGLAIGAHPSYPDRANFGRVPMQMTAGALADSIFEQVSALGRVAERLGVRVAHVKPHGALYNRAALDRAIAEAIARGVRRWRSDVILVGLAGSPMLGAFREAGFAAAGEAFADRRYEPDGTLRARHFADALIADPAEAARQALGIAERGRVTAWEGTEIGVSAKTICIHSDTPGAVRIAEAVTRMLREADVVPRALAAFL